METLNIGILFFIELVVTAHGYIISTQPEIFVVGPNEAVTMKCEIDGSDYKQSKDIVKWFKIQGEPGELDITETNMARIESNFIILAAYEGVFTDSDKYPRLGEPSLLKTGDTVTTSSFEINDVQPEDSGYYVCQVKDQSVVHQLWYQKNFDKMDLWNVPDGAGIRKDNEIYNTGKATSGDKLIFYEDKWSYFECYAEGGLPPPKLKIYVDDEQIEEKYLVSKDEVELVGDTEGMQRVLYNNSLYSIHAQGKLFDAQSDGKTIKCETQTGEKVEKIMDVYSRPFVIPEHCESLHETPLGKDVKIICRFYSKPAPSKVFWKNVATGGTSETSNFASFVELTEKAHTFEAMMMIDSITSTGLGIYKLMLQNDVGIPVKDFEVTISEGPAESTSGTATVFTSHLLLSPAIAMCVFLYL